jgi:hypothetical protein
LNKTRQAISPNYKGEGARERILKEYDWNILIKKIDSIYEYSKKKDNIFDDLNIKN